MRSYLRGDSLWGRSGNRLDWRGVVLSSSSSSSSHPCRLSLRTGSDRCLVMKDTRELDARSRPQSRVGPSRWSGRSAERPSSIAGEVGSTVTSSRVGASDWWGRAPSGGGAPSGSLRDPSADVSSRRFSHPLRRSEEHTSELQSRGHLAYRLLL